MEGKKICGQVNYNPQRTDNSKLFFLDARIEDNKALFPKEWTQIISALKKIPVKQNIAMTGSLSVRGEVLPIGGVSAKIEAAIDTGVKKVIVPKSNINDIVLDKNLT
jgi:predicted ATPase with chaperone activity